MGYTHYWYRPRVIDAEKFAKAVKDFQVLLPVFDQAGIKLAGWDGAGNPEVNSQVVSFNGLEKCGHLYKNLGIAWPSGNAGGLNHEEATISGNWFAGALLVERTCGGDCSHETFRIEQVYKPSEWEKADGKSYFSCCKTAFKPYDIAVTACLIIFKHHLGKDFIVRSDGEESHWFDAKQLCQMFLGYGFEFKLDWEEVE